MMRATRMAGSLLGVAVLLVGAVVVAQPGWAGELATGNGPDGGLMGGGFGDGSALRGEPYGGWWPGRLGRWGRLESEFWVTDGVIVSVGRDTGRIVVNTWDGQIWDLLVVKATRLLKSEEGRASDLHLGDWVVAGGVPTKLTVESLTADQSTPPTAAAEGEAGESSGEPSAASTVSGFGTVVSVGGNVTSTNPLKIEDKWLWGPHSEAPRDVELDVPADAVVWRVVDATWQEVVRGTRFAGQGHGDYWGRMVLDTMVLGDALAMNPGTETRGARGGGGLLSGMRPVAGDRRGGTGRVTFVGGTIVSSEVNTGCTIVTGLWAPKEPLYIVNATRLLRNRAGRAADVQVGDWVETYGIPAKLTVRTLTAGKPSPPPPAAEGEGRGVLGMPLDGMAWWLDLTAWVRGEVTSTNPLRIREATLGAEGPQAPREMQLGVPAGAEVRLVVDVTREEVVKGTPYVGEAHRDSRGRLILDTMILGILEGIS